MTMGMAFQLTVIGPIGSHRAKITDLIHQIFQSPLNPLGNFQCLLFCLAREPYVPLHGIYLPIIWEFRQEKLVWFLLRIYLPAASPLRPASKRPTDFSLTVAAYLIK